MPKFDPDKAAFDLGLKAPSAGSPTSFDPDKAAAEIGISHLPNKGEIQDGASDARAYAQAQQTAQQFNALPGNPGQPPMQVPAPQPQSAQSGPAPSALDAITNSGTAGMSLGGLGRDLAPFVSAAFPTAIDKAKGNDYFDRVLQDKSNQDSMIQQSRKAFPVLSMISEGVSSVPKQIALSEALGLIGVNGMPAQAGSLGALEGLTQSKKNSMLQMVGDTVEGGATGYLMGSALNKYAKLLQAPEFTQSVDELGNSIGRPPVIDPISSDSIVSSVKTRPNGDFEIKLGKPSMAQAYTIGKEEGKLLTDPDLRATVTDRMNDVFGTADRPGDIPNLIQNSKEELGKIRDPLIKQYGAQKTNALDPMKKAWDFVNSFNDGGNDVYAKAASNFKDFLTQVETGLRTTSPSSDLADVPLHSTFTTAQNIGDSVFGKTNLYRAAPPIKRAAQDLYFGLRDAASAGDTTGQIKTLGNAFSTLYKMDSNADLTGDLVSRLNNPDKGGARAAYEDFVAPLKEMNADDRAALLPKLQEYIANELPSRLNAKATVNAANIKADSKGGIGWVLNKLYLDPNMRFNASGAAGAASEIMSRRIPQLSDVVGNGVSQVGNGLESGLQSLQNQMNK